MIEVDFYNLMMDTFGALGSVVATNWRARSVQEVSPQNPLLQLRRGFAESPAWFLVQAAEFDPEPLSVKSLRVRDIYASESLVQALLELIASEKWFDRLKGEDEQPLYYLTAAGRAALEELRSPLRQVAPGLEPLPAGELARLESLLRHLIEASLESADPPGTWCLAHSRKRAPAEQAAPLVKIAQLFADFNAFRDDAHMAAWQRYQIEGYVWETFSLVWSGTANSAETVYDQLAYRGYTRSDYTAALPLLAQQGWLAEVKAGDGPAAYQLTERGRMIREEAEHLTQDYFYAPWLSLTEAEVSELQDLLTSLHDSLQQL